MINIGRIGATIHFEPRDLWVGAYWDRKLTLVAGMRSRTDLHVYLTLLPMWPIHFVIRGKNVPQEGYERLFRE